MGTDINDSIIRHHPPSWQCHRCSRSEDVELSPHRPGASRAPRSDDRHQKALVYTTRRDAAA
ncbi:hypothetical protein C8R44DRAFT_756102 [Mycena epipterygia]|nr:hypothetical protein C8R44DRAFT_756102 [Mycena epipterygia]